MKQRRLELLNEREQQRLKREVCSGSFKIIQFKKINVCLALGGGRRS
jgi:hypothetical protein